MFLDNDAEMVVYDMLRNRQGGVLPKEGSGFLRAFVASPVPTRSWSSGSAGIYRRAPIYVNPYGRRHMQGSVS